MPATNKYPNIILIILDTVRADRLSCYGHKNLTTPDFDKIAQEGILYENCYSPSSWTLPSHASIFTGSYLSKHNVGMSGDKLGEEFTTLASSLKHVGYETFGICYIPWVSELTGLNRGFDNFISQRRSHPIFGFLKNAKSGFGFFEKKGHNNNTQNNKTQDTRKIYLNGKSKSHWLKTLFVDDGADYSNELVKSWIKKQATSPFFAFINYCEAHAIYHPPLGYRYKYLDKINTPFWKLNHDHREFMYNNRKMTSENFEILKALYDGEINYLNSKIKDLYNFLKNEKILDNTLLIITSDHGEQFGEKGFMGHARNLYNSLIKVPLVIKFPGERAKNQIVSDYVQTVDIFPTIIDLLNMKKDLYEEQIQGNSLISDSNVKRDKKMVFSEYKKQPFSPEFYSNYSPESLSKYLYASSAVIYENFKYIWRSNNKEELYNISEDRNEDNNLVNTNKDIYSNLKGRLNAWLKENNATNLVEPDANEFEINNDIRNRLMDLGYL